MVATGKARSTSGTRPEAENTRMKATSCSSITRSEPITPPSIAVGCRSDAWSGSDRGATASEIPDIIADHQGASATSCLPASLLDLLGKMIDNTAAGTDGARTDGGAG